ncbi:diacylglycerol kinase theta [Nematostella vectensis]|uniref:diacylglycerol kinase theta n=1 Tax=Nematostella vectensis TaxID=45351 RepID=UPI00207755C6|nr:diacylglycerol kinase theta [Nematostella vectensis]
MSFSYYTNTGSQSLARPLSAPILDEAFQAHGQSGHRFVRKTFTRPTYCHHCTDMLWGFTNQGFMCDVCNFVTHDRCMIFVTIPCVSIATTLVKIPVAHTWSGLSFSFRKKFCSVCRRRLEDIPAFRCQVCDYYVHEACQDFSVTDCKQSATYVPFLEKRAVKQDHHWREGNFSASSKCVSCKHSCGSGECLASLKCSWCAQSSHTNCSQLLPKECHYGYLHRVSLPPFCVSFPDVGLWGPYADTQAELHNNLKGDFSSNEDDGIVSDVSCTSSMDQINETFPINDTDPENTSIKVYDGNLTSPRASKSVTVPRNAKISKVLDETLKSFHINDDPDNYYLAKAVDEHSERPLDPEEIPVQFPEKESKPLIFLRIKSADKRKGYIRIYAGTEIDVPVLFKTLPVIASTSVSDIISVAMKKFGIWNQNQEDYALTEVHLIKGVQERVMEAHECPWKTLMDIRKQSIRDMKLTRFYLRRRNSPLGPVTMCIGDLPTSMDRSRYEIMLNSVLGELSESCEFKNIYPTYGMVFVRMPGVDVAAKALTKLKRTPIDGKTAFVKILPSMHPEVLPPESDPLLVFVNCKSGGGQGDDILSAFQRLLNPHQVYNLMDGGPLPGLYAFKDLPRFRILICGGDGTVGWVLSCLDDVSTALTYKKPPSAIVPLGTGNDMSRVLQWGSGYSSGDTPLSLLIAVDHAEVVHLDRWFVMFDSVDSLSDMKSNVSAIGLTSGREEEPNMFVMNNYLGIGIDADLCLDFHLRREEAPEKFTSRLRNKGVYFRVGLRKMANKTKWVFSEEVEIEVDGEKLQLPTLEGIVILNIGSWAAGADLWGPDKDDEFRPSSYCDCLVEVVGLTGVMQMGQIQSGIRSGVRLAQGAQINIKLKCEIPVQIDGEPWMQSPGNVIIRPALMQTAMLQKRRVKSKEMHERAITARPTTAPGSRSVFYADST